MTLAVLYLRSIVNIYYLLIFLTDLGLIKDGQMIKMDSKWYTVNGIVLTMKQLMPSAAGIVRKLNFLLLLV